MDNNIYEEIKTRIYKIRLLEMKKLFASKSMEELNS